MFTKIHLLYAAGLAMFIVHQSALAADSAVTQVFTEVEHNAAKAKNTRDKNVSKDTGRIIRSLVDKLSKPDELSDLVSLCNQRMAAAKTKPLDYCNYFLFVQEFAIEKLGDMNSPEAVKALDQVHELIKGNAHVMECWDEAREKQQKHK